MVKRKPNSARRNVHVVPYRKGGHRRVRFIAILARDWRPLTRPTTQTHAIAVAILEAKRLRSEVVIHRANGRIRDKDSYGRDSRRVKDTKH